MKSNATPLILYFFLDAVLTALFAARAGDFVAPKILALHIGAAIAVVWWLMNTFRDGEARFTRSPLLLPAALLLAANFASAFNASAPYLSFRHFDLLIPYIILFIYAGSCCASEEHARGLLRGLLVFGFLLSVHGIAQHFGWDFLRAQTRYHDSDLRYLRVYSTFGNSALLAEFLAPLLLLAAGLVPGEKNRAWRIFAMAASLAMAVCIVLTHSRAAHVAVLAGAGVFILFSALKGRGLLAGAAVAIIFAALGAGLFLTLSRTGFKNESIETRQLAWKVTLKMFAEQPVSGVGAGNFAYRYLGAQSEFFKQPGNEKYARLANWEKPKHAHNEFLETAAETGVPGLAAMLLLLIVFLWKNASGFLRERNFLALGVFSAAAAFWLEMCVGLSYHIPPSGALFWLLLGIGGLDAKNAGTFRVAPARLKWEIAFIAAAAVFALLDHSNGLFQARTLTHKAQLLISKGQPMEAAQAASNSLYFDAGDGETWFTRGVAFEQLGFFERAISDFHTAEETSEDPNLRYHLAMAHFNTGQTGAAIEEIQIMEGMIPGRPLPKLTLAKFYFAIGDREKAIEKMNEAETLKKALGAE